MSQWSALIYGRTYEVDFRMLAMPDRFTDEDKQWALKHILATTDRPDRLLNYPRWSVFSNGKYCAIGVTCTVKELVPDSNYQEDVKGRALYVFVGYVARLERNGRFPPLPEYGDLELARFASTYERYIPQCWLVKSYEQTSKQPILTRELEVDLTVDNRKIALSLNPISCNLDPNYRGLYPEVDRASIWNCVVLEITNYPDRGCSLALGLEPGKEIDNSPFLNRTLPNLNFATKIKAIRKTSKPQVSPDPVRKLEPSRDREAYHPSNSRSLLGDYLGAIAIGSLVGVFSPTTPLGAIVSMWEIAPLLFLGSTIGSLAIGCITNRGVGGVLRKKTGELLTTSIAKRERSRDFSSPEQRNQNFGLKEVDRKTDRHDWY